MNKKRLNIGLLVDDLEIGFSKSIAHGAELAARELDANLFMFPGKYLKPDYLDKKMTMYNYQFNTIFPYASVTNMDIIFVLLGSIASTRTKAEQLTFLHSLGDGPIVTLCCEIDDYPAVCFDNTSGFSNAIEHLIVEHGAKIIGFMGGPETNNDAIERENVYRSVMKKYNLPVKESYIAHGNFSDYCTDKIEELLDRNEPFDALVCANDNTAFAAYKVFAKRGIKVGSDILVVGFDDEPYAVSIEPPLTTVKANAANLGYRAVIQGVEYLETGIFTNCRTNSSLILRKSCGCKQPSGEQLTKRLGISNLSFKNPDAVSSAITDYLFKGYITASDDGVIKQRFLEFINLFFNLPNDNSAIEDMKTTIAESFASMFSYDLLNQTTADRLFDSLRVIHYILETNDNYIHNSIAISDLFYHLYRTMAEQTIALKQKSRDDLDQVNHRINSFTREIINFNDDINISYEVLTEMLKGMNITDSFLYTFPEPIRYLEDEEWTIPSHVCLKAYHNSNQNIYVSKQEQLQPISRLFINDYTDNTKRATRILIPLFSGEYQYGLMVCELNENYYSFLNTITSRVSSAIRTLYMMEQQKRVESELENNLIMAQKNTEYLENISKIDELSHIYNRRGFYEQFQNIIANPDMQGHSAVLLFGDIDGLKIINDVYGHNDGDIAIQTISEILTEAFSYDGIVCRFGGDEFAVLCLVSQTEFEQVLLPSFMHIKHAANERLHMPYKIDMSLGYSEFTIHKDIVLSELLKTVDEKLYTEKKRRKTARK
ncbi:MAG: GGDEF domain-containing protein [Coprococcus sp.]